jgi:hypothetical protein
VHQVCALDVETGCTDGGCTAVTKVYDRLTVVEERLPETGGAATSEGEEGMR